jgi:hypothetical protein
MGTSTAPEEIPLQRLRRARLMRRAFLTAVFLFLVAGALGALGVRTSSTTATAEGYELEVRYGAVSRPGLATPWSVTVTHEGGFDGPVKLATTAKYFDLFDENGLDPEPSTSTTSGDLLVWEFEPPEGNVLEVSFDARIEPAVQLKSMKAKTFLIIDEERVAQVAYRTLVLP